MRELLDRTYIHTYILVKIYVQMHVDEETKHFRSNSVKVGDDD